MKIKDFWKLNKYDYIWSCVAFTLAALLMGAIKHYEQSTTALVVLFAYPVIFLLGFGMNNIGKE